jgi:hypothetical protein
MARDATWVCESMLRCYLASLLALLLVSAVQCDVPPPPPPYTEQASTARWMVHYAV